MQQNVISVIDFVNHVNITEMLETIQSKIEVYDNLSRNKLDIQSRKDCIIILTTSTRIN